MRGESEGKTWTMVVSHAFYSHRGEVEWGVGSSNERHTGRGARCQLVRCKRGRPAVAT
jgi:hypothetical protein